MNPSAPTDATNAKLASTTMALMAPPAQADQPNDVGHRRPAHRPSPTSWQGKLLVTLECGVEICFLDDVLRPDLLRAEAASTDPATYRLWVALHSACRLRNGEHVA